jgi:CheY-like chemotaxis protein
MNGESAENKKKVLVVDDNVLAANAMVRLLCALGWDAESRYSAQEARNHLREQVPDLMLLDIGMPEMDGYEFVGIVRNELQITIPVIALSGYSSSEDRAKAQQAGFTSHLVKPIAMQELQQTLLSLLNPVMT